MLLQNHLHQTGTPFHSQVQPRWLGKCTMLPALLLCYLQVPEIAS